jgi:membrane-bound metal-dependent hydrolase YbcI (DUF457 family)
MFAIGHAATALIIKRRFPEAPMAWVLVWVQLLEILWVVLNVAGIERATAHMPYSHSVAGALAIGLAAWLLIEKALRRRVMAAAAAVAIVSHMMLDLVTHRQEIVLVPFVSSVHLGLGLYELPPLAVAAGTAYGLLCWLIFRGSKALLALILFFNLANLSFMRSPIADQPDTLVALIAAQVILTTASVWFFSRDRAAELEHPERRLARAFA